MVRPTTRQLAQGADILRRMREDSLRRATPVEQIFHVIKGENVYTGPKNRVVAREFGNSPTGINFSGSWVLRDEWGHVLAWDKELKKLAERWNLKLNEEQLETQ